jgi:hypothetical protein
MSSQISDMQRTNESVFPYSLSAVDCEDAAAEMQQMLLPALSPLKTKSWKCRQASNYFAEDREKMKMPQGPISHVLEGTHFLNTSAG